MLQGRRYRAGIVLAVVLLLVYPKSAQAEDVSRISGEAYNRAVVNKSGLVFRVPEPWYWRPQDFDEKFHLTRAKLAVIRDADGEWVAEYGQVCNKMLSFEDCVAHIGSSGWLEGGDADLHVRAYVVDEKFAKVRKSIATAGAAEAKRLSEDDEVKSEGKGGLKIIKAGAWAKFAILYPRFYWDYGGIAHVDCFARPFVDKTVVMVFMYRGDAGRHQKTIQSIVESVHWLDETAAKALFEGRSEDNPGEPIDPPPPTKQELRNRRIAALTAKLESDSNDVAALFERARLYEEIGNSDNAIADYEVAHKLAPGDTALSKARAMAYRTRGISESAFGPGDYQQAVADLTIAIKWDPSDYGAFYFRGGAWFAQDKYDKAIADYDTSILLRKGNPAASYSFRGLAKLCRGDKEAALADLNRAIDLAPTDDWWLANRAEYWMHVGQYGRAIADLVKATDLQGSEIEYWITLTWIYASCADAKLRDPAKALKTGRARNIGTRGGSDGRQALAAAHAAAGQFDVAVKLQTDAISLIENDEEKSEATTRLHLYKSGKPFEFSQAERPR